jgi:cellulose synthase (UDP-forming)
MESGDVEYAFPARVTSQRDAYLGVQFVDLDLVQLERLIQCTFGRADAWSRWHEQYASDLPLRGLQEIIALGLRGYVDLARGALRAARLRVAQWRRPEPQEPAYGPAP